MARRSWRSDGSSAPWRRGDRVGGRNVVARARRLPPAPVLRNALGCGGRRRPRRVGGPGSTLGTTRLGGGGDHGSRPRRQVVRDLATRHEPDLPTLLSAGPPITVPDGHSWYLGGEVDPGLASRRYERPSASGVERACDVVKIMVTGGFLTPTNPMWESQFSLDEVRIVVDEAHRHGLPVAAHCHGVEGIERAVRAKVDSIEHCSFLDENLDVNASGGITRARRRIEDSFVAHARPVAVASDPAAGREEPRPVSIDARTAARGSEPSSVCGTDAGIGHTKPHDVLPYTLADFVGFGLTPEQGLRAMTRDRGRRMWRGSDEGPAGAGLRR